MSLMEKLRQKRAEMEAAQQKAEAPKTLEEIVEAKQPSSEETQEQKQEETTVSVADTKEEPTAVTEESTPEETSAEVEPEPVADNTPSEDKDYTTMQPVVSEEKENENEIIAKDTASEETEETVKEESKTTEETTGEEGVEEKPKRRGRPRKHKEEEPVVEENEEETSEEESTKPEPTPEILSAIEEDIAEQEKEERPKKKSIKKHESVEQISYVSIDVLGEKLDVDTATAEYLNYFIDTEWQEKEKYFLDKVTNIRIEADMNPGTLKFTLADLCALNDEVMPHYLEQKKIYDSLVNKDFGSATAFKIANSTGSNSEERKRTGTLALMKAKINGQEINYISLINAVQMRYNALSEIMKMIKYKSDICITMASAIKIEMQLVNG